MMGRFDRATGGYVDTRTPRETRAPGWVDAHPYVDAEYVCDCGYGVIWCSEDFYAVHGSIPLSVAQARSYEALCEWCAGGDDTSIARLAAFTLYAPGWRDRPEHDDALIDWSAYDLAADERPFPTGTDKPGFDVMPDQ
jgi:hypothetical protein